MRPQYVLPLVSALALALPALAVVSAPRTTTSSSVLGTNNTTSGSLAGDQIASTPATGLTTGVRPIDQERLGIVSPDAVSTTSTPVVASGEVEMIDANGERVAVNTITTVPTAPAAATPTPTPELDAATRAAERKLRAKTARKQQLMHSITPRTNVDRTDQMPDDPISPAVR